MTGTWTTSAVGDAFRRYADRVEPSGPASWRLLLRNGKPLPTDASVGNGVLRLSATTHLPKAAVGFWPLLVANRRLPSGAKYVLDRETNEARVVVEALGRGEVSTQAIGEACTLLLRAEHAVREPPADANATVIAPGSGDPPGLDEWSDDAPVRTPLGDGRFAVDCEARGMAHRVVIERTVAGVRCGVELGAAPADAIRREALALLLLTASDSFAFARGAADEHADRTVVHFEVQWGPEPAGSDVERGVMTLMAACAQVGPEVRALGQGDVAAEYVAMHGQRHQRAVATPKWQVPNVFRRFLQGG